MSEKELNQLLDTLSNIDDDCKISNAHEDFELEEVMEFCFSNK